VLLWLIYVECWRTEENFQLPRLLRSASFLQQNYKSKRNLLRLSVAGI